jgi:hypothetical protein
MKTPMRFRLLALLTAALLAACATTAVPTGAWQLTAPDGSVVPVNVSLLSDRQYYLSAPRHPISGAYKLDKTELRIVKPDNVRMGGYVWHLNPGGSFVLIEETPVQISGQRLISSTLIKTNQ